MKQIITILSLLTLTPLSFGAVPVHIKRVKQQTETQLRGLVDPLLSKYCADQCKLLEVQSSVQPYQPDQVTPGFDEVHPQALTELVPASARLKLLVDEMMGPVSRGKMVDLIQQHVDVLDYPVIIDVKTAKFPQPLTSTRKVSELRDQISNRFKTTLSQLFQQFCPHQCTLADFDLKVEPVNAEEAQYGGSGEFFQEGDTAVRVTKVSGTLLLDTTLTAEERANIVEMARLKTNYLKNVELNASILKFPHPIPYADGQGRSLAGRVGYGPGSTSENINQNRTDKSTSSLNSSTNSNSSSNSTNSNSESANRSEKNERYEKIERVENGDAVQAELKKFQLYAAIFGGSILLILTLLLALLLKGGRSKASEVIQRIIHSVTGDPQATPTRSSSPDNKALGKRYEIDALTDELVRIYAEHPKVAKIVFSRVLTEEGVDVTAQYVHIFGESVVLDLLRDPSLQQDLSELLEFYARNTIEITEDERLELLRRIHNRTVAAKMIVFGKRSSNQFEFLVEMDALQILELIRNESLTIKAIVMTQVDAQKRQRIFSQLDESTRMKLLAELSRIDYLPKDYIFNAASALKRKRTENPRLNTEALPGSDVLVGLLEKTSLDAQRSVIQQLQSANPDHARLVKNKLVSIDSLPYLRDSHLLEVVLGLKHDELLQFLKGAPEHIRKTVFSKSPRELVAELEEQLSTINVISREVYSNLERKLLNRVKMMANEGTVNLIEVNEKMFGSGAAGVASIREDGRSGVALGEAENTQQLKKVAGW
jgi:flagellar motor switch protein FliG